MKFISTRGKSIANSASEAVVKGIAEDGGLFVPEFFPDLSGEIEKLCALEYFERSAYILSKFFDEYNYNDLLNACKNAYSKFDGEPAPLVKLDDNLFVMELFHGPTLAFKDIALTLLPFLLKNSAKCIGKDENVLILVATSGDTGKAALEGFKGQKGVKIMVFYPSDGVSDMQKLQMKTQEGDNVSVVGVKGNFDDCQSSVKKAFHDKELIKTLKEHGYIFSSANSISFGRLSPQIVYYFSAYCDLVNSNEIKMGDKVDFVVPTGNFGDILAGYYAKKMGLPINKLVCASNSNNVLTEFFNSGEYNKNREFYKTSSPSMDILISSNLERLIYEISGRNSELTSLRMKDLSLKGEYSIFENEMKIIDKDFYADYCDEEETKNTIKDIFNDYGYVLDTHTAVAFSVENSYKNNVKTDNPVIVLSTASAYKFPQSVYKAITDKWVLDPFICADKLYNETGYEIPYQVLSLKEKPIRFNNEIEVKDIKNTIIDFIK